MTRIIVRAMPERAADVAYLRERLPDAEFCFDRTQNAKDTFLAALAMAGAEPCVHMEEDVILTRDFRAKLAAALAAHPDVLIQFFSMRKADLTVGSRWEPGRTFMMNQCFYLPAGYSAALLAYAATWPGWATDPTGYDLLLAAWLQEHKLRYWLHVPSLVQHRVERSLINPRRSSRRQSLTFTEPWL